MQHSLGNGSIFGNRYRVVRCIAAGGMGAVYEVVHIEIERRRALKVMLPHIFASPDLRERFKREARIAAEVDSEHIIEIFDAGVDDATEMPFLVMELLKGEEVAKRLKRLGRFPPADVLTYLHQTALALDEMHRASIVHRDLKPENLFLTERKDGTPRIKVLDFGIAKLVADGTTGAAPTQALGTPLYMAPEQFRMDARVSPASDIYALGHIAYTLLVGVPYWREELNRGGNVYAFVAVAMLGPQEPATPRAARAGIVLPPAFDAWFAQVTAVTPEHRFASATAAVNALGHVLGASGLPAPGTAAVAPHAVAAGPNVVSAHSQAGGLTTGSTLGTIVVSEFPTTVRQTGPAPRRYLNLVGAGLVVAALLIAGGRIVLGGHPAPGPVGSAGAPAAPDRGSVDGGAAPTVVAAAVPPPQATETPTTDAGAVPISAPTAQATSAKPTAATSAAPAPKTPAATGQSKKKPANEDDDIYRQK